MKKKYTEEERIAKQKEQNKKALMKMASRSEDTPLSPMEETFCYEYLKHGKLGIAAKNAGSNATNTNQVGYLLIQRPNVAAFVAKLKKERAEQAKVDSYYILEGLKEVAHRCLQKTPVLEWNGEEWVNSGEWKFDSSGANKAFELIGKHIGFFEQDNNSKRALIQINIDNDDMGL